jgi:CDP-glycerol glycerophosphotransferase
LIFSSIDTSIPNRYCATCFIRNQQTVRTSEWYTAFHGLLSDPKLHEALSDHEWRLVFYPHYGAQPFLHLFDGLPECIVLASRHDFDVQQLLMESKVLVTDFSSVSFDFAYMRKPVVYLLPDEERYFADHFQRGYFDFERDGFGPAHRDPMTTVQSLIRLIQSEARPADQFKTRIDNFFGFHDTDNSRRVLEATLRVCDTGRATPCLPAHE